MSTIDERVVRMEFDNKQFETGVSETMSSLQKLKAALNLRGSTDGMQDLQKAADKMNFGAINDQIYQVQQNFSFLGEFVRTIFDRISNKVIDLGTTMAKELTIRPLTAGFDEYQLQMDSTQTIMASTGKSIDEVTDYLDKLNEYADRTIYSFSDMTANIGKFTNAGVDLDMAVKAIQGISNEAAVSGANANEASRAMYNFAQALSAGAVKLVDWKSIENANMATVEFKDELIKTAVELGTLKEKGDGFVSTTKDMQGKVSDVFTTTKGFNESLSAQWMTTDVLTKTLAKYADETTDLGKKAFAAAQDVKTFRQLVDTVKESLGSGWTKSFQLMIGNLEEAKVLWTGVNEEINSILDPIAKAREEMLQFWHDNGGRDKAIEAISNAWEGLKSIMGAVSSAFRDVFPPMTGKKLVKATENIRAITERFKEFATSSETIERVRNIFAGLFSILKGFADIAWSIMYHIQPLIGAFRNFGALMFQVASQVGAFVEEILGARDPIKALGEHFGVFGTLASNALSGLSNALSGIMQFGLGWVSSVVEGFSNAFSGLGKGAKDASEGVERLSIKVLPSAQTVLEKFVSLFSFVGKKVGELATDFSKQIPKLFEYLASEEFRGLITNFNAAIGGGLLLSIKNLIDVFRKTKFEKIKKGGLIETIKEAFQGVNEKTDTVLGGLSETLTKFQESVKAGTILTIAISLGILAGSIALLGSIEPEKVATGLAAVAACLGMLVVSFDALNSGSSMEGLHSTGTTLIKMAVAVGILALSIKALSKLSMDELKVGFTGLFAILGSVIATVKLLSKNTGDLSSTAKGLITFSIAVRILATSVKALAELKMKQLKRGLIGVGILLAEIAAFDQWASMDTFSIRSAISILGLAAALKILEGVVKAFAGMKNKQMTRGLNGVAVLLLSIAVFSNVLNGSGMTIRAALSILTTVAALKVLEGVVTTFAHLKTKQMTRGLEGVAKLLFGVAIFAGIMSSANLSLKTVLGVAVMTLAISSLADVVKSFSALSGDRLSGALQGLATSIVVMTGALLVLSAGSAKMIVGAAALALVMVALKAFIPVLQTFANIPMEQIQTGLGGLGVALALMAGGLLVFGAIAKFALMAAAALAALGGAAFAVGAGLTSLAAGMGAFSASFAASTAAFAANEAAMTAAGQGIADLFGAIGEGIIQFIENLANGIGRILAAVSTIVRAVGKFIITNIPYILSVIGILLISVFELGMKFIPKVRDLIGLLVVTVLDTLVVWLPTVSSALINAAIVLLNSFANGLRENAEPLLAAVRNILSSIFELVLTAVGELLGMIPGIGDKLSGYLEKGREAVQKTLAPETMESYTTDAMGGAIRGVEEGGSEMADAAGEAAKETKDAMAENLSGGTDIVNTFIGDMTSQLTSASGDFSDAAGGNIDAYFGEYFNADGSEAGSVLTDGVLASLGTSTEQFGLEGDTDVQEFLDSFDPDLASLTGGAFAGALGDGASSKGPKLASTGKSLLQRFTGGAGSVNTTKTGEGAGNKLVSGTASAKPAAQNAGIDLVRGFSWGAMSPYALSLADEAGAKAGHTAVNSLKRSIRSQSPSREAMKVGKWFTQGFAIGIGSMTDIVNQQTALVGKASLNGIRSSISAISKYVDSDIDFDPTIRPVLDLSEIQNGMSQLDGMFNQTNPSLLVGFGDGGFAQSTIGSLVGANANSVNPARIAGAFDAQSRTVNVTVNLQYDASADANELARGIARAVQPYVVRGE